MLTKTKIALSALLVVGFASAALANGTSGYAVGDTWIEPAAQQTAAESAFASATVQHPVKPLTAAERTQFERASAASFN
jgi:hypothetical protein